MKYSIAATLAAFALAHVADARPTKREITGKSLHRLFDAFTHLA
jgi:hypothetical protein